MLRSASSSELSARQLARARPSGECTELVDDNGHVWVRVGHGAWLVLEEPGALGSVAVGGASDSVSRR